MTTIAHELEIARQSLLDLTLRNRLLNHRPSRLRSIRVVGELPAEVYDALVLREKALEFRGTKRGVPADDAETWVARAADGLASHHTDRYLQTPYDDESLAKKLFRVYHEARSAVEEQGYTVAHLAIGFLEWFESAESDQPRRAPLILVPAELERVRAGDFSKVRWTGEDVFANISLIAKLAEHGVVLPPFEAPEEKGGIDAWLGRVVEAIARKPRWRVLSELTLDFFSFTKFVMFKDLDPATWPAERKPHDHPLLQTLFRPSGDVKERGFDANEIDARLTARDLWHVMDADPSQIAVIEDVKAGRNLVVEGPPGTGKSQTITNLIAETLAAGKTVLFVSEKMAALEVVKSRLDAAGLGPFCLELHSRKSNKKAVLAELQRSLETKAPAEIADADEHELLKRDLNRYARELAAPVGAWQRTPYHLIAMRTAALASLSGSIAPPPIANVIHVSAADVAAAENALREIGYVFPSVHPVAAHPWRASTRGAMMPQDEQEVRARLAQAIDAARAVREAAAALAREAGVRPPETFDDIARATHAAELLAGAGAPTEAAVLTSSEWNAPNAAAEELVARVEAFQRERLQLARTFRENALESNIAADLHEFGTLSAKFFRFLDGRYRALRRELAALYTGDAPKPREMLAELSRLAEHQSVRDALRGDRRGRGLFGARWLADKSDCAALRAFAEWIVAFRRELVGEALTRKAVDIASTRVDATAIRASIDAVQSAAAHCRAGVGAFLEVVCIDESLDAMPFPAITARLEQWQDQLPSLFRWTQFNAAREVLRRTAASALEPYLLDGSIDADRLIPFFRLALAESLLRHAFAERAALSHFDGELHEKKIVRFRELDAGLVAVSRARLSRRLHASRPRISGGASPSSEVGILVGELHRKRGHMPIRKLLTKAGALIQRIKPCFLMSPLSIAQFLDPRAARFDLIVFDEASQVRPEDAIGAFLRGSQVVVMGDPKQLPPTSFFDRLAAGDDAPPDDEEAASMKDVESILHQCARSFPAKTLEWHYRSRHESLIAISNLHFYDNKLRIYPSAVDWSDEIGLHFVHVPRAVYDRGKSGTNRIEAQTVAAAALDHFRRFPDKSLGIGTFNIQQQQAIQEELELQLRAHPEMEAAIQRDRREPLFVKNLETIQGDERDTILISLGFGRDAAGKLSLNFGPINYEGGERRLNVLITRAREKCVVFSNFTAHDLVLDGTNARGVFALKAFLEFAQTRRLTIADSAEDGDASAFEDAIAQVLAEHGYVVRRRVGCAGFRVDLAIVDSGRYLLGIECDGPKYHGATVARDRDRLRQQMLEQLGWSIHRVWSVDWYRNREETVARLLAAAAAAKSAPRSLPPPPPAPIVTHVEIAEEPAIAMTDDVPPYEVCRALRIPIIGELHLVPAEMLAAAVEDVVVVEGPVHIDEVVRRIRTLWGLQRAGNRIREAIERGAAIAIRKRAIAREGDFLCVPNAAVAVRRRNGDPPARAELISDAELAEAVQLVLRAEFSTPRPELIDAAARRVGFQATSSGVELRLTKVIDEGLRRGRLSAEGDVIRAAPTR